jgi:hypothetical protein
MSVVFRVTEDFICAVRADLMRPHPFAHERVGFVAARAAQGQDHLVILAESYHPVDDHDYLPDPSVGAMMGQEALRKALDLALLNPVAVLHIHMHGEPPDERPSYLWFSDIDLSEQLKFVPDFFKVRRGMPHGAIVLSPYSAAGRLWLSPDEIVPIAEFDIVGSRMTLIRADTFGTTGFYG